MEVAASRLKHHPFLHMSTAVLTLPSPVETTELEVGKKGFIVALWTAAKTETDLLINATDFQMGCRAAKDSLVFSQQRDAEGC